MGIVACWKFLMKSLKDQTKEFLKNSTLHGVNYIADESLHSFERLTWLLICCLGVVSTGVTIALLWEKFQTNPTITGLDTDFHDWDVPFPAITLCSAHPYNIEYIKNLIRFFDTCLLLPSKWNSSEGILEFGYEEEVCQSIYSSKGNATFNDNDKTCLTNFFVTLSGLNYNSLKNFKGYASTNKFPQNDLRSLMWEVVAHCEDIFRDCKWKDTMFSSCCAPENPHGMRPIFTDHGFCYSFNSHKAEQSFPWLNKKLAENKILEIYETDESWDFSFKVKETTYYPIKVFIHDWNEVPAYDDYPQHEWDGFVGHLEFSAKTTYTTPETRQLSVRQRQCIFPDEIKLTLDPDVYTHSVCVRECQANEAMDLCGCVPPIVNEIGNFKHCNLTGMSCLAEQMTTKRSRKSCTCELSCLNTVYEVETLTEGFCKSNNCQSLRVGFVSWPMVRYKREVLFGWVDLLVSFGGVAGLFLGFSLLSGVEIIYYFVVKTIALILVMLGNRQRKRNMQSKVRKKLMVKRMSFPKKDFIPKDSFELKYLEAKKEILTYHGNSRRTGNKETLSNKHFEKKSVEIPNLYLP